MSEEETVEEDNDKEPSMEDILASIRGILAEEKDDQSPIEPEVST